jgi:broad specificity phosphatase PhoE
MSEDAPRPPLRRTDRDEAPLYLARYFERQRQGGSGNGNGAHPDTDESAPLYLRRFRERRATDSVTEPRPPLWQRAGAGMQRTLSEDNRNKEIVPPPEARPDVVNDLYLVRHGETQGYSTESGLTPAGSWQAHTWGRTLAKRIKDGERVVLACAATNRAGQTAEHIARGLLDGLAVFEKDVDVSGPDPSEDFRNFGVATPSGVRDVTAAFRQYYAELQALERTALGDRPLWLVEIDRFWRTQQAGGDPIQHWLTIPMLHFEPPALCVRRFWRGIQRMSAAHPGARLVIATHSGPIRAFAVAALGYDPGEPYNTEHVRIKLLGGGREAVVSYRNRAQEIQIPDLAALPDWVGTAQAAQAPDLAVPDAVPGAAPEPAPEPVPEPVPERTRVP